VTKKLGNTQKTESLKTQSKIWATTTPSKQKRSSCSPSKQKKSKNVRAVQPFKANWLAQAGGESQCSRVQFQNGGGGNTQRARRILKNCGARGSAHSGASGPAIFHAIQGHLTNNTIMMKCFPPGAAAQQQVASFVCASLSMPSLSWDSFVSASLTWVTHSPAPVATTPSAQASLHVYAVHMIFFSIFVWLLSQPWKKIDPIHSQGHRV